MLGMFLVGFTIFGLANSYQRALKGNKKGSLEEEAEVEAFELACRGDT